MSLRTRLGFDAFRKRDTSPPPAAPAEFSPFHQEYAKFCAYINPAMFEEWFRRGLEDLPRLVAVAGVGHIGFEWHRNCMLVLTEPLDAQSPNGTLHEIGEIMVCFNPKEKRVSYENMTHPCFNAERTVVYAHPHILNGTLCSSAGEMIMQSMMDARFASAMTTIVRCIRMRRTEIGVNTAYKDIEHWPVKENGGRNVKR